MSASQLVVDYLTALTSGDMEKARSLVDEEFSFQGPRLEISGKDEFLAMAEGKYPHVRGFRMLRQWEDGDEVCSLYEFEVETPAAAASMLMSEWNTVREGRLTSSVLVFDTGVQETLMPQWRN